MTRLLQLSFILLCLLACGCGKCVKGHDELKETSTATRYGTDSYHNYSTYFVCDEWSGKYVGALQAYSNRLTLALG